MESETSEESPDLDSLLSLAAWTVRQYKGHRDWEDIEREAHLGALIAVRDYSPNRGMKITTWVAYKAQWQVVHYLRRCGPRPHISHAKERGYSQPEAPLYLEDLKRVWWGSGNDYLSADAQEPRAPDFTEPILQEVEYDQMWTDLVAVCTPRQLRFIYEHIICGATQESIAIREGVCFGRVSQVIKEGLDKYRSLHGIATPRWKHKKDTQPKNAKTRPCRPTRQSR